MTTTQKAALVLVTTALLTTGVYQQLKYSTASKDLKRSSEALVSLRTQLSDAEAELARAKNENRQLKDQNREIHRLRGELAARNTPPPMQIDPVANRDRAASEQYLNSIDQLKSAFQIAPESLIPEMSLIGEREWLEAAIVMQGSAEDGLQKAMAHLRTLAKGKYSLQIMRALQRFVDHHGGPLPNSPDELAGFLENGIDRSALARYEVVRTGTTNEIRGAETIIREKIALSDYDSRFNISLFGAGYASPKIAGSERTYGFSFTPDDLPR